MKIRSKHESLNASNTLQLYEAQQYLIYPLSILYKKNRTLDIYQVIVSLQLLPGLLAFENIKEYFDTKYVLLFGYPFQNPVPS